MMARVMIALVTLALLAVSQGPIAGEARAASYTERTQALLGDLATGVTIATAAERRIVYHHFFGPAVVRE